MKYEQLRFEKCIGQGNFGEVWAGSYKDITVAIKKLFFAEDILVRTYIEREVETLQTLHHQNIVQLLGVCSDKKDCCIVTGRRFNVQHLKKYKYADDMKMSLKLRIAYQIADAMAYVHSKDILHRDLKAENVLLTKDGLDVKICDFGVARQSGEGTNLMTKVGTDLWMAPEVLREEEYGKPADVFSFGMVLWELLNCTTPPKRRLRDKWAFIEENAVKTLPWHYTTSGPLWSIMIRCLATNPDERPTFEELKEQIGELVRKKSRLTMTLGRASGLRKAWSPKVTKKENGKVAEKEREKEKGREKKKKGQPSPASDRRKKLLVFHVKDSHTSPFDFFGFDKEGNDSDDDEEENVEKEKKEREKKAKRKSVGELETKLRKQMIDSDGSTKRRRRANSGSIRHKGKTLGRKSIKEDIFANK